MKRIILSLLLVTYALFCYPQSVAEQAREAYDKGSFGEAIELLENELKIQKEAGLESSELYYNLGNAYYRMNKLAEARLNYERALLINPGDRDIRHNIDYLSTQIEDKILIADTFFINMWFRGVQNLFTSNAWAGIGIFTFMSFIACLGAFFFTRQIGIKKTAFYIGLVMVIGCIFANVFAAKQMKSVENRTTAIVMSAIASVHSSPDRNSKDVFTLHAGTKMEIIKEDRSWLEIEISDGSVGWILREKIEII